MENPAKTIPGIIYKKEEIQEAINTLEREILSYRRAYLLEPTESMKNGILNRQKRIRELDILVKLPEMKTVEI